MGHSLLSFQNKLKTLNHRTAIFILVLVLKLSRGHGPGPICRDYPGLDGKVRRSSGFSVHPHSCCSRAEPTIHAGGSGLAAPVWSSSLCSDLCRSSTFAFPLCGNPNRNAVFFHAFLFSFLYLLVFLCFGLNLFSCLVLEFFDSLFSWVLSATKPTSGIFALDNIFQF